MKSNPPNVQTLIASLVVAITCCLVAVPAAQATHSNPSVIATIPVGSDTAGVGVNSATNRIYVANCGPHTVSVIDGATNAVVATVAAGVCPIGVGVNSNTNRIYVANANSNTVSVIDGATNAVVVTVPTGTHPIGVGVNSATNRIYVANDNSDNVSVIDGATNAVVATVPTGTFAIYVGVNPTTNRIYVSNRGSNTVSVIDGTTNVVVATVPVDAANGVGVNSVTNRIYVGSIASNDISVIDGATNAVVATVPVGAIPDGVGVNSVTNRIYVANNNSNTVSVIDGATNGVVATVPVGNGPLGVGVNPTTDRVYVANNLSATVSVIAIPAKEWNLAHDFRVSPNQANPNPDNLGTPNVWHFMQSTSLTRDPSTYTLLPQFISDTFFIQGLQQWQTTIPSGLADPKNSLPAVGINTTGVTKTFIGIVWPAGAIRMHPSQQLAIVGWQSPINGRVGITGAFSDLDNSCGGGVSWFIDQGNSGLTSGSFASGGTQSFNLTNVSISQGEFVYFLVDPRGPSETNSSNFGCDSTQLNVTITQVPAPAANAGPDQSVNEGVLITLNGSGSIDPNGLPLTYQWTQLAGPPVALNLADPVHPTFTAPQVVVGGATLTFQLIVNNGAQTSAPDTVNINVMNVNHPPVSDAGLDQMVQEGSPVMLDGSGSFDPDAEAITYQWTQTAGPTVALSSATAQNPTFTAPNVGVAGATLTFSLTVHDGQTASVPDTVNVNVQNVNHPPVADAGPDQTKNEGTLVSLSGVASQDPDGDTLTFAWTQVSGTSVTLTGANTATPTFTAPAVGPGGETLAFRLVVSDGQLASNPTTDPNPTVAVMVQNVNDPPVCSLAQPNSGSLWPPNHTLVPVGIVGVSDPENNQIAITVTGVTQDEPVNGLGDGDTSPDAVLQGSQALLRAERSGTGNGRVYEVHFTASDNQATGGSCSGSVKVSVPHSKKSTAVDDGQNYNSTLP